MNNRGIEKHGILILEEAAALLDESIVPAALCTAVHAALEAAGN